MVRKLLPAFLVGASVYIVSIVLPRASTRTAPDLPTINQIIQTCPLITDCQPEAGDILIKRKITGRTRFVPTLFSTYFTHAALYVGDGEVVEAQGYEPNNQDEVIQADITKTEWIDPTNEKWLIIRPNDREKVPELVKKAIAMAASDSIVFGYGKSIASKKHYCSGLVNALYADVGLVSQSNQLLITPDTLATTLLASGNFFLFATSP